MVRTSFAWLLGAVLACDSAPPSVARAPHAEDRRPVYVAALPAFHPDVIGRDEVTIPAAPPGHPRVGTAAVDEGRVHVDLGAPVGGYPKGSHAIDELRAARARLAGTRVQIRGRVVAVHGGILGTNWVRLRDRVDGPELVVATDDLPRRGDLVLAEGPVAVDLDIGGGYVFDVLLRGAEIQVEEAAPAGSHPPNGFQRGVPGVRKKPEGAPRPAAPGETSET
jgi:hypothetical protein